MGTRIAKDWKRRINTSEGFGQYERIAEVIQNGGIVTLRFDGGEPDATQFVQWLGNGQDSRQALLLGLKCKRPQAVVKG